MHFALPAPDYRSDKDVTRTVLLMTPITISIALLVTAVLIAVAYVASDSKA